MQRRFLRRTAARDDPDAKPMIAPSQGVHIVLPREFLPGRHGDHGAAHAGRARDVRDPVARARGGRHHRYADPLASLEPAPLESEVDFILETASSYLAKASEPRATSSASSPESVRW
jgi:glycerol-3-phosphate dehydrogenase